VQVAATPHDHRHTGFKICQTRGWMVVESIGGAALVGTTKIPGIIDLPSCKVLIAERRIVISSGKNMHCGDNWKSCWR